MTPGSLDIHDLPRDLVAENMPAMNSSRLAMARLARPDQVPRARRLVEAMGVMTVATAHGPVLTGDAIREAFDVVRDLAGKPIIPGPGQEVLDEIVAQVLAGAAAGPHTRCWSCSRHREIAGSAL